MKVIFIKNVAGQGKINDIKEVADSFALNVLLPKAQAIMASKENINKIEVNKKKKELEKELSQNNFFKAINNLEKELKEKLDGILQIKNLKKNEKGFLFSALHESDIISAIFDLIKINFSNSQIILPNKNIKEIGIYEIKLKDKTLEKTIKIKIV